MADLPASPLETVTVEHPDTPGTSMIINKSDFNPAIHQLYEPPAPKPEGAGDDPGVPKPEGGGKEGSKSKNKPEK